MLPPSFLLASLLALDPEGKTSAPGSSSAGGPAQGKSPPGAPFTPSEQFNEGKVAFARGQYRRALDVLRPLIRPEVLLESENDLVQTHRMLGVAFLFENQPSAAREEFRQLLELRPESRFDPLLDPPFIVEFFNGVLKEQQAEIRRLEHLRERAGKSSILGRSSRPLLAVRNPYAVCFFPFGAGQFQNGERRKGWAFLGSEGLFASASVAAFVTNFALYGIHPRRSCLATMTSPDAASGGCPSDRIDHHDEDVSRTLTKVQVGTGILFFATAIWGVVDAVRSYRPFALEPADGLEAPKGDGGRDGGREGAYLLNAWPNGLPADSAGSSSRLGLSGSGLSLRF